MTTAGGMGLKVLARESQIDVPEKSSAHDAFFSGAKPIMKWRGVRTWGVKNHHETEKSKTCVFFGKAVGTMWVASIVFSCFDEVTFRKSTVNQCLGRFQSRTGDPTPPTCSLGLKSFFKKDCVKAGMLSLLKVHY